MIDTERLWVCDSETVAYDNLWVFLRLDTGECLRIHNDNIAVRRFIDDYDPILIGFNIRDYDQHILKANLLDYSPKEIKEVNDVIIHSQNDPLAIYNHFQGEPWVDIPPLIDLIPDIVNKPSLKQLEGFMGMSIEESSVPFDIDRPLTEDELEQMFDYCEYDVRATAELYKLRIEYVNAKAHMCELCGVDPLKELKHPMARVAADLLGAVKREYDNEDYIIPDTIQIENIPAAAYWFAQYLDRDGGLYTSKRESDAPRQVLFDFHGCPSVMGVGGMHSAIGHIESKYTKGLFKGTVAVTEPYHEAATEDRVILIQDIGAYYPNTVVKHDYMSRSIAPECADIYPYFLEAKDEAKANGDIVLEKSSKLFINAITGTFRSQTNKLSDPMQGISLCITGQLYMLDLIERLHLNTISIRLIQINTDGWVISIDKDELPMVTDIVTDWCMDTGYKVDTGYIKNIWQRDVNNYGIEFEGNKGIKVKGGTVGGYFGRKKNWSLRGFAYSNTIVDKAIVDYLVSGTSISDTINNETDLSRFQIITKAGSSFPKVYGDCREVYEVIPEGSRRKKPRVVETTRGFLANKVNRIYATKDRTLGKLMKETQAGNLHSFPDTPEHALVDNKNSEMTLDMLDRDWYTVLTQKKLNDFLGTGEQMSDEKAETTAVETPVAKSTVTKKPPAKKAETTAVETFAAKVLKLQVLVREALAKIEPDSYIDHINYEYVNTGVYKDLLAECCQTVGLIYDVQFDELNFLGKLEQTRGGANNYGATVKCYLVIANGSFDADDGEDFAITNESYGFGLGSGGNCVSSAQTNGIRNAIVNGFLVKTTFEDDVAQANKETDEKKKPNGYLTDSQKEQAKAKVAEDKKDSVAYIQKPAAVDLYERLTDALAEELGDKTRAAFEKLITDHYTDGVPNTVDGHLTVTKKLYTSYNTKLDELGV